MFFLGNVTYFIQVVLEVAPPENNSSRNLDLSVDRKSSEKQS